MARRRASNLSPALFFLAALLLPVWLPLLLILYVVIFGSESLWKRYGPISSKTEPKPLSKYRSKTALQVAGKSRRPLSLPPTSRKRKAYDLELDERCGFFKLPWELREQIWDYLLVPSKTLRILQTTDRLVFTLNAPGTTEPQPGLLAFLKTNRRIYNEGIEQIYIKNTFTFHKANVLTSFQRTVAAPRLHALRHLVLDVQHSVLTGSSASIMTLSFDERIWRRACKALTRMSGLHTLKIVFRVGKIAWERSGWTTLVKGKWPKRIFEPLMEVRAKDSFVFKHPWPSKELSEWPGAPFKMRPLRGVRAAT